MPTCQIISLHTPLNDKIRGLINQQVLSHAKNLILINTFFGADVYWDEPLKFQDPWNISFLQRKNVLITPHMSWYSLSTEKELRRKAAEEVLRVGRGKQPLNPVNTIS